MNFSIVHPLAAANPMVSIPALISSQVLTQNLDNTPTRVPDTIKLLLSMGLAMMAVLLSTSAAAQTVTVSGVKYEQSLNLRGSKLVLNGAGVRYKGPFQIYTAGLYTLEKAGTPGELLTMPGPKRLSLTMLREIDSGELGKLFSRNMAEDKASFSKLLPDVMRMSQLFSECKKLMPGDIITIDWVPSAGTVINVWCFGNNQPFKDPAFYSALLRIWLGPSAVDWKLKEALMGKPA